MKQTFKVHNVNDYARYIGAPELHPLVSVIHYDELVKEITGNTIRRFVMKRAQQLLISGSTVSQTADQLGFDYPQHFTRMFKKHYGLSPSDYLKLKKKP